MDKNNTQTGLLTIFNSLDPKPLQNWEKQGIYQKNDTSKTNSCINDMIILCIVKNGHIMKIMDQDIQSTAFEIIGLNVNNNFITSSTDSKGKLGIKLPFFALVVKNLRKYFTFEIEILDDKNMKRRFVASNYQVKYFIFSAIPTYKPPYNSSSWHTKVNNTNQAIYLYNASEIR